MNCLQRGRFRAPRSGDGGSFAWRRSCAFSIPRGRRDEMSFEKKQRAPLAPGHSLAPSKRVDFARVNQAALQALPAMLRRWLPAGRLQGREYTALNPRRSDRRAGSFSINMCTCQWADFATGASGGDPTSLAASLFGLSQAEAARRLANMLGITETT